MKTVQELMQEREALFNKASDILDNCDTDNRDMTDEEKSTYSAALDRIEVLDKDIATRQRLESLQKPNLPQARVTESPEPGAPALDDPAKKTVRSTLKGPVIEAMRGHGKLHAFKDTAQGREQAYRCGQWLAAVLYGNVHAADWCRQNGLDVRSALSGGVQTAGGALVPEEFERSVIDLREQYGLFRRVCRVTPMSSDTKTTPRKTGGLSAYFVGEGVNGTESDAGWDNVSLTAKKLMVLTRMSSEIAEDAIIDLADDMALQIGQAFAQKEDLCGFLGDGTSAYGGIVGVFTKAIDGSHTKAAIDAASGHDLLTEIDADDLISLMAAIPTYAKPGARWYCSPAAQEVVFNAIKIAGGGNTRDMLSNADTPRFLGYPIEVSDLLPDSPSTNYNNVAMIGFGNLMMAATLGNRRGIRVALSDQKYWTEDQIGIKGTERFDINVHDLGSTTKKSPFAVLVGNT